VKYSAAASERSFDVLWGDGLRYLHEMSRALEAIWAKRPTTPDVGYLLISDGDIPSAIIKFVTDFGHVSTLLFDEGLKRTSENGVLYRIRTERVKRATEFFDGIDLSVFKDRRIRNRHFHADEYVTKFLVNHPDAVIVQDLSVTERGLFSSDLPILYIRVYEYSNDLLLHLDAEFDAKKLYETTLQMIQRLNHVH
jgi:hypothetical protein